jgi:hypothetical protein
VRSYGGVVNNRSEYATFAIFIYYLTIFILPNASTWFTFFMVSKKAYDGV